MDASDREIIRVFIECGERAKSLEQSEPVRAGELYTEAVTLARRNPQLNTVIKDLGEVVRGFEDRIKKLRIGSTQPKAKPRPKSVQVRSETSLYPRVVAPSQRTTSQGAQPPSRRAPAPAVGSKYTQAAEELVVDLKSSISMADIVGLEGPKKALYEMVVLPALNPAVFTGLRQPPTGLLLFGPPGNGKTMLAKAVASECGKNTTFFNCSASALTSKWHGEDEKLVKGLFETARARAPSIVFMDEVDALLSKRSSSEHESSRRLKNELLTQLDGVVSGDSGARVVVLGATNRPMDLDEAVLRRFPKRVYLPLPDVKAREAAVRLMLKSTRHSLTDQDLLKLATTLEGYSHSDIAHLCKESALLPLRNVPTETLSKLKPSEVPAITFKHMTEALGAIRPSVNREALSELESWNKKYGVTA